MKSNPSTPVKGVVSRDTSMVQEDFLKFYKESGLEPLAREVEIIELTSCRSTFLQYAIAPAYHSRNSIQSIFKFVRDSL